MKAPLSWLREYLDTDEPLERITETLTAIGLEVESVENPATALAPFTTARILSTTPHPNADRLKLCRVDTGEEELTIVCGAPNAREGLAVALAREGAVIPASGDTLKPATIRGVASEGMLCSARELGLGQNHDGILELPENTPPGQPLAETLELDDPVIDIAITPNRGDCFGLYGIARDLAAAGLGRLRVPDIPSPPENKEVGTPVTVTIADRAACPQFLGRSIRGVTNGPSPDWLRKRLEAAGLRPISALVDITNYFTHAFARPMHVYDAAKLKGNLIARPASKGESLLALDEKTYALEEGMTVIADAEGPVGLAGIIGGLDSAVGPDTREVFLEIALFDPVAIARVGQHFMLTTDARQRFERGVDPLFPASAMEMATAMILECCGGEAGPTVSAGETPRWEHSIAFDPALTEKRGGLALKTDTITKLLEKLGCSVYTSGSELMVDVPSWRPDLRLPEDLVEEILRLKGYDAIEPAPLPKPESLAAPSLPLSWERTRRIRRTLATGGMLETRHWGFTDSRLAAAFHDAPLRLRNPISAELDAMRPSLLANMLLAAARNAHRGEPDLAFFETGRVFYGSHPEDQPMMMAGLRVGQAVPRNAYSPGRPCDAMDAKADLLAALEACGFDAGSLPVSRDMPPYYHPGRAGSLRLGKTVLGSFGMLHPKLLKKAGLALPAAAFELFLEAIPQPKFPSVARPPWNPSELQPVLRDFAFVLDEACEAEELLRLVRGIDKKLIAEVTLFDVFRGGNLGEGKKSLAICVTLQPRERTLTEEDINALSQRIIEAVEKKLGGALRG